jgi:GLPGLI family protein
MKNKFWILLILISTGLNAQNTSGKIVFERYTYWVNMMSKFSWMTSEDVDREMLTWGKDQGKYADKYDFVFTSKGSVYQPQPNDDNYGYSWKADAFIITKNREDKEVKNMITLADKDYLVEGDMTKYKWKILNEIKEIAGYLCMKAETTDPIKNTVVHAWFTNQIPIGDGPEGYGGLPGMILGLELNNDDVIIEASSVTLSDSDLELPLPKKMKGKKSTPLEYNNLYAKVMKQSIDRKRNPYWRLRY